METQRLVDYFVVCGLNQVLEDDGRDLGVRYGVVKSYPQVIPDDPLDENAVCMFAFPNGFRALRASDNDAAAVLEKPAFHPFVITKEDGTRVRGASLVFYRKSPEVTEAVARRASTLSNSARSSCYSQLCAVHSETERQRQTARAHAAGLPSPTTFEPCYSPTCPLLKKSGTLERIAQQVAWEKAAEDLYVPQALVLLSRHPFVKAQREYLFQLYEIACAEGPHPRASLPLEEYVHYLMSCVPLPVPGTTVEFELLRPMSLSRPNATDLPLHDFSLEPLFKGFGVDGVIDLVESILLERKMLVRSRDLELMATVLEGLVALMYPFAWNHVYVPVLGEGLLHFLEAPVPYIMGVPHGLLDDAALAGLDDVVFVDLDTMTVEIKDVLPHLPERDTLFTKLSSILSQSTDYEADGGGDRVASLPVPSVSTIGPKLSGYPNDALRWIFADYFVGLFMEYASFLHMPRHKEGWENEAIRMGLRLFDRIAFLSDQPPDYVPFFTRFVGTQAFSSFIDAKISSIAVTDEDPDPAVEFMDGRIEHKRKRAGFIMTPSFRHQRATSVSSFTGRKVMAPRPMPYRDASDSEEEVLAAPKAPADRFASLNFTGYPVFPSSPVVAPPTAQAAPESSSPRPRGSFLQAGGEGRRGSVLGMLSRQKRRPSVIPTVRAVGEGAEGSSPAVPLLVVGGAAPPSAPAAGADQAQFVAAVLDECSKVIKQLVVSKFADSSAHGSRCTSTEDLLAAATASDPKPQDAADAPPTPTGAKVPKRTSIIATEKVLAEITASQADALVTMLCEIVEQIFNYGLRTTEGAGRGRAAFWSFVSQCTLPEGSEVFDDRARIQQLSELKTDVGRGRSFIRLAVEKKLLAEHLEECLKDESLLERLYKEYAFVRSEEARFTLMSRLAALRAVDIHSFSTKNYDGESHTYHVSVHTADVFRAGSSANTFVSLEGRDGRTDTLKLEGRFERGAIDQFDVSSAFLGPLHTVTIGHDNSGFSPGWFLDKVVVEHVQTGRIYEFPCRKWLALDEDDGQIVRELRVSNVTTRSQQRAAEQAAQAAALTSALANKLASGALGGIGEAFSKTLTRSFSLKTSLSGTLNESLSSSSLKGMSASPAQAPATPQSAQPAPASPAPSAEKPTATPAPAAAAPQAGLSAPQSTPALEGSTMSPSPRMLRKEMSLLKEETSRRVSNVMAAFSQKTLMRSASLPVGAQGSPAGAVSSAPVGPVYGYPAEPPRVLVEMRELDGDATLQQLRQAIKALTDHFETPSDRTQEELGNSDVNSQISMLTRMGFATAIEQTLFYGFKSSRLFGAPYRLWNFIEKIERPERKVSAEEEATPEYAAEMSFFEIVGKIKAHPYSAVDAKFRAFICYGLNLRMLHHWIQILANNPLTVKWFDKSISFLRNPTLFQLLSKHLQRIRTFPFSIAVTIDLPEPQLLEDPSKPSTPADAQENETTNDIADTVSIVSASSEASADPSAPSTAAPSGGGAGGERRSRGASLSRQNKLSDAEVPSSGESAAAAPAAESSDAVARSRPPAQARDGDLPTIVDEE